MKRFFVLITIMMALVICSCDGTGEEQTGSPSPQQSQTSSQTNNVQDTPAPSASVTPASPAPTTSVPASESPSIASEQDTTAQVPTDMYSAIPLPEEMRAMWFSFIEWQSMDLSTQAVFQSGIGQAFDNCKAMGLNTVIVSVRPFSDALYESAYYPWSHLVNGTQGQEPLYDPLEVMIMEAHARGLRVEAWINPYRVQHPTHGPDVLSQDNPAVLNSTWVREQGGLWLDPGLPEVKKLVTDGVIEIVENYDVDGIHFDDYFYPEGNTADFDAETYATYGNGQSLEDWRRKNVNTMVSGVYSAIKEINPSVSFGISPQGNNENNYNEQHCDIKMWMSQPGYADYIMPQLYWGFNYIKNDDDSASFSNKVAEWSSYPLHEDIKLYAGLGAYRIGDGDYSDDSQGEWENGHDLADMVAYLREAGGFEGFALFHYDSLYPGEGSPYFEIAVGEVAALTAVLQSEG